MRTLETLSLLVVFILAAILPQQFASPNGPMPEEHSAVQKCNFHPVKLAKGGPATCALPDQDTRLEWCSDSEPMVCRSPLTVVIWQISSPMVI